MSWREELRKIKVKGKSPDGREIERELVGASFRGVTFFVDSAERSIGRRVVSHEFPYRNAPFHEDLGKKGRGYRVEGYVIGDNYIAQRDKLADALDGKPDPGQLVHPYYGTLTVVCVGASHRESKADGGMCMFSMEFLDAPAQSVAPTVVDDPVGAIGTSASAAIVATQAEFVEKYDVQSLPGFALESAEGALKQATAALNDKLAPIVTVSQELAEFAGQVSLITARATSLVRQPAEVLSEFRAAIIGLVQTTIDAPFAVMTALAEAYDVELDTSVIATTATRARELANLKALIAGLRRVVAVEAARLAPVVAYPSNEEAIAARDRITAMLDDQAASADDTSYPAIVDLRSKVLHAVPGGQAFASVITVTRKAPIPSLLLTYQLYGSVKNERDVIARNGIAHPGFVVGDLRVLSDE